jgi:hypothetical protein
VSPINVSFFPFSFLKIVAFNMVPLSLNFYFHSLPHFVLTPRVDHSALVIIHIGLVATPRSPSGVQEKFCRQTIFVW